MNVKGTCQDNSGVNCQRFSEYDICLECPEDRYKDITGCLETEGSDYQYCQSIKYKTMDVMNV